MTGAQNKLYKRTWNDYCVFLTSKNQKVCCFLFSFLGGSSLKMGNKPTQTERECISHIECKFERLFKQYILYKNEQEEKGYCDPCIHNICEK